MRELLRIRVRERAILPFAFCIPSLPRGRILSNRINNARAHDTQNQHNEPDRIEHCTAFR